MEKGISVEKLLVKQLQQFIPVHDWFDSGSEQQVNIQVFRVFRVPFENMVSIPSSPLVVDFKSINTRAVFGRGQLVFPNPDSYQFFQAPDGRFEIRPQQVWIISEDEEFVPSDPDRESWHSTGDGVMLFLLSPADEEESFEADESTASTHELASKSTRDKLTLARAAIVTMIGRNAAFEELLEVTLSFEGSTVRLDSMSRQRLSPTTFEPPKLHGFGAKLAKQVVDRVQALEERSRNRILLALRWYLLAQRHPPAKEETDVDIFVSYWIAFEALTMPDENVSTANKLFAEIHKLTTQEAGDLLLIGRISGLRGRILHYGETPNIDFTLLNLMNDLFVDALAHKLGIAIVSRTEKYLDGSAIDIVP